MRRLCRSVGERRHGGTVRNRNGRRVHHLVGLEIVELAGHLVRERLRGPADDPEGLGRTLADRLLDACGPEVRALVEDSRR